MRRRNMMEHNSQGFVPRPEPCIVLHPDVPPVNAVPNLEGYSLEEPHDNPSMFYGHPDYYRHQGATNLSAGMSTAPNFYPPYAPFYAPPSHLSAPGSHGAAFGVTSVEHEGNPRFMGHGYKRKSVEVIPGSSRYPSTAAPPPYFPLLNTPETAPFSSPQFGTYSQPLDDRSVRNRAGAATLSHGHNGFIQGSHSAHPFPPPSSIWYDQRRDGNRSDGSSSSLWSQAPSGPYMHGNVATGSLDSGNVCFPRYHEASSSRNPTPFVHTWHNYFTHLPAPPPPPAMYPRIVSASYAVPESMHDASYGRVGQVQPTRFRINQQFPRDDFVPAATLRHHGLPQYSDILADEVALFGEEDFYDYDDLYEDMRLDIEDMSYEELLALSDHIGTVKTGLSEKDVKDLLKRRTSLWTRINLEEEPSTDLETDSCTICQENYKNQDKIATLDCRHEYHAECLMKWLVIKNVCPICKSVALVTEKQKKTH